MKTLDLEYPLGELSPGLVWEVLADLRLFGQHHPFMTEVVLLGEEASGARVYRVSERLRLFGFIPQRPRYEARVELVAGGEIVYEATLEGRLQLRIVWQVPEGAGVVRERIELSPAGLAATVLSGVMRRAHAQVFERLASAPLTPR